MSSLALPTTPGIASAKPRLFDIGGILTPIMGGPAQRLIRPGARFAVDFGMPSMMTEPNGRIWVNALAQGLLSGVTMRYPQPGLAIGSPGSVLVNGALQVGTTLIVDGAAASYPFKAGQFFTLVSGGRGYLHHVTADQAANGSGQAVLSINPPLRLSPADNDVCNFATPYVEGVLSGNSAEWNMPLEPVTNISFTVTEMA